MSDTGYIEGPESTPSLRAKVQGEQLDLLVRQLDCIGPLPELVNRLLALGRGGSVDPPRLIEAVGPDSAATERVISAAGSESGRAVDGLADAVSILGAETVRSAVIAMKVIEAFGPDGAGIDRREFWTHSLAVAATAEQIARRLDEGADPAAAFLAGLLHDVGKMALATCLPKSYARVLEALAADGSSIAEFERDIIGIDHAVVGRRLAQRWSLPESVQQAIWLHHQPLETVPQTLAGADLVAVTQLADTLVRERGIGFSGNAAFPRTSRDLADELALTGEDLQAVADELAGRLSRLVTLVGLDRPAPAAPAGEADQTELAQRNAELEQRVAGLERRLAALAELADLARRITSSIPLPRMCLEMARTTAAAAGIAVEADRPACAFALPSAGAQAILAADTGEPAGKFRFASCRLPDSAPVRSPCPAGPLLQAVLHPADAWGDLLDLDTYTCLPLIAGDRWIGGILLPVAYGQAGLDEELTDMVTAVLGFILAATMAQAQANRLTEQLALASRHISESKDALAQAETLTAIGEMAAGAAHEMNTPLAVIAGRAQLMAESAKTQREKDMVELITRKADEISNITTDLMEFARPGPPKPQVTDVAALLAEARDSYLDEHDQKTPPPRVDIHVEPECPKLWADPRQIRKVLEELVLNAVTASGGSVHVRMDAARQFRRPGETGPAKALLRVVDDGPGMDESVVSAAFTPFFSHRPAGRGRGMGLARARRYVQANGGRIWIESRKGKGTTVCIELPQAKTEGTGDD